MKCLMWFSALSLLLCFSLGTAEYRYVIKTLSLSVLDKTLILFFKKPIVIYILCGTELIESDAEHIFETANIIPDLQRSLGGCD